MRRLFVTFEDEEFEQLLAAKAKQTWHSFVLEAVEILVTSRQQVINEEEVVK